MKNITAMKKFFESGKHGRKVETIEFKELTKGERNELGAMCCAELGETHEPTE